MSHVLTRNANLLFSSKAKYFETNQVTDMTCELLDLNHIQRANFSSDYKFHNHTLTMLDYLLDTHGA